MRIKEKILVEVHFSDKQCYEVKVFDSERKEKEKWASYGLRNRNVADSYVDRLRLDFDIQDIQYISERKEESDYFTPEYVAHSFGDVDDIAEFLEQLFFRIKGFSLKINIAQDSEYLYFSLSEENSNETRKKVEHVFTDFDDIERELFDLLFGASAVKYVVSAEDWGGIYLMIPFACYRPVA